MASEPQPSSIQEGATEDGPVLPTNAEDRKAAAALSSLDSKQDDEGGKSAGVDTEALGKAMKNLGVSESNGEKPVEKKVKVEAVDVALLVKHLELNKVKATELLKANDGDAVKAMTAFVTAGF